MTSTGEPKLSPATVSKRRELQTFVRSVLADEPSVQGVIGIGSIASGLARPDSDIDAVLFLDPFDWYVVPAEFQWRPADGSFHSIFQDLPDSDNCIELDVDRCDLARWADPSFAWPEGRCAELQAGWLAFDRTGAVAELIATRTVYTEAMRRSRLDEAVTWLDQHLGDDGPQRRWESLGSIIAHDRLNAAYAYLVQALFAYNRRWRPWRNREMSALLSLPWLPPEFERRVLPALGVPSAAGWEGYLARVELLQGLFHDLLAQLIAAGDYGEDPVSEAFIRSHDEPGYAWTMDEWNAQHQARKR